MNQTSCSNCDHCEDFMKRTLRRQMELLAERSAKAVDGASEDLIGLTEVMCSTMDMFQKVDKHNYYAGIGKMLG